MTYYKLTDEKGQTFGCTQWGEGITHAATGPADGGLCSNSFIHGYTHPLLAVLFNPGHAAFSNPMLWESPDTQPPPEKSDGLKCGFRTFTTAREIPLPAISLATKVRFAIYVAQQFPQSATWNDWAKNWLTRKDRSATAEAAAREAEAAAWEAAWAAAAGLELDFVEIAERAMRDEVEGNLK